MGRVWLLHLMRGSSTLPSPLIMVSRWSCFSVVLRHVDRLGASSEGAGLYLREMVIFSILGMEISALVFLEEMERAGYLSLQPEYMD